jgi:hypothetical protein
VAFTVLVAASVSRIVEKDMTKQERRSYNAPVAALKGEGYRAGGKRLMSTGAGDYPLCQRALYGSWRMVTGYRQDGSILIVAVDAAAPPVLSDDLEARLPSFYGLPAGTGLNRSQTRRRAPSSGRRGTRQPSAIAA